MSFKSIYIVLLFCGLLFVLQPASSSAQIVEDYKQSFSLFGTFAADSSHIIGAEAEQRKNWTAGVEYSLKMLKNRYFDLSYKVFAEPFFQESDPDLLGGTTTLFLGSTVYFSETPVRVVYVSSAPIGYALGGGLPTPIYPVYGAEKHYAFAASPVGLRVNAFPHYRIQPTLSADWGVVFSGSDLIIANTSKVNFSFSVGPGIEVVRRSNSIRAEYVVRHIENEGLSNANPGIDQGVSKVSLIHHF